MTAGCRTCGAPVRVAHFAASPCSHCGDASPLRPHEVAPLNELRQLAQQRVVALEQWDRKLEDFGQSFGAFELFGAIFLWLIIGGPLLGVVVSDLPDGSSLLFDSGPVGHEVSFARWIVTLIATSLALSALCATAARWYGRKLVLYASALQPVSEGAPPRCRRCGGALPRGGAIRRCTYCHADSIVDGAVLAAHRKSVKGEISHMRAAARGSMQERETIAVRLRNALFVPPFVLLVTFPIFWFVESTPHPAWIWSASICALLGVVVFLFAPRPIPLTRK